MRSPHSTPILVKLALSNSPNPRQRVEIPVPISLMSPHVETFVIPKYGLKIYVGLPNAMRGLLDKKDGNRVKSDTGYRVTVSKFEWFVFSSIKRFKYYP